MEFVERVVWVYQWFQRAVADKWAAVQGVERAILHTELLYHRQEQCDALVGGKLRLQHPYSWVVWVIALVPVLDPSQYLPNHLRCQLARKCL